MYLHMAEVIIVEKIRFLAVIKDTSNTLSGFY